MHTIGSKAIRGSLFAILVTIVIISLTVVTLTYPYNQTAQAFPCLGYGSKEYCLGYRAGAIQAKRDYNTGNDLSTDQHLCAHNSTAYCRGYNRGYSNEADFLG